MISDTVVRELQIRHGWTRAFIDRLAPYYLATLTHMHAGHATPVFEIIDAFWHAHILCTRDYADFCRKRFGRFIHHERIDASGPRGEGVDFFRDYGLSLPELTALCTEYGVAQGRGEAKCGQGKPKPKPKPPTIRTTSEFDQLPIASCTQPSPTPPTAPAAIEQPLALANCTQPDQPIPPDVSGREPAQRLVGG